jgi:hypothetical protein
MEGYVSGIFEGLRDYFVGRFQAWPLILTSSCCH